MTIPISKVERVCEVCSAIFLAYKSHLSGNSNTSGRFCKRACYNAYLRTLVGPKHPKWAGGNNKVKGDFEAVKKRLWPKHKFCCLCGSVKRIHIHHIVPYRYTQDNDASNLIPLCGSCHPKIERITESLLDKGFSYNTLKLLMANVLAGWQMPTFVVLEDIWYNQNL